jgi:multisubunit Na+/H+ antiporter MnhF subunit
MRTTLGDRHEGMRADVTKPDRLDDDVEVEIAIHIFSVSAAMVGVCLTVIGIIRLIIGARNVGTLADDLLAFDALMFLAACLLAYSSMRSHSKQKTRRLESIADNFFILALLLMVLACGLVAYAVI